VWTPSAHASAFDAVLQTPSLSLETLVVEPGAMYDEADETLDVLLPNPQGGVISDGVATVLVADDTALEGSILRFAAKAPDDFTAQSLTLVRIPAGATEAFFEVPTADDERREPRRPLSQPRARPAVPGARARRLGPPLRLGLQRG
jgi:hypothetical protein